MNIEDSCNNCAGGSWKTGEIIGKKYCYVATNFSYASAEFNCIDQNAILFEPKSDNENTYVYTMFDYYMRDYTWIGINDRTTEGSFVYTSTSEPIKYSGSWGDGQPDDDRPCKHNFFSVRNLFQRF